MKKWVPPLVLLIVIAVSVVFWLISKRSNDQNPGVQSTPIPPSADPGDPDSVEEFGEGPSPDGGENTFEMPEDEKQIPGTDEPGGSDEGGMGQEMDGMPRYDDDPNQNPSGLEGSDSGEIDQEDGVTVEAVEPLGTSTGTSKETTNPQGEKTDAKGVGTGTGGAP